MYTVKDIYVLMDSLERNLESFRLVANSERPLSEKYASCIHIENGEFTCSVWNAVLGYKDKNSCSLVTHNDIISGCDVCFEQDEYCQIIKSYLCNINKI